MRQPGRPSVTATLNAEENKKTARPRLKPLRAYILPCWSLARIEFRPIGPRIASTSQDLTHFPLSIPEPPVRFGNDIRLASTNKKTQRTASSGHSGF
jgi:hypothetical protein